MGVTAFSRPQEAQIMNYYVPLPFEQIKSMAQPYQQMSNQIAKEDEENKYIFADSKHLNQHTGLWKAKNIEANDAFTDFYDKNKLDFTQGLGAFNKLTSKYKNDPYIKDMEKDYDLVTKSEADVQEALKKGDTAEHNITHANIGKWENIDGQWRKNGTTTGATYDKYIKDEEINKYGDKMLFRDASGNGLTFEQVKSALDQAGYDPQILRELNQRAAAYPKTVTTKDGKTRKVTGEDLYEAAKNAVAAGNVWKDVDTNFHFIDDGSGSGSGSEDLKNKPITTVPSVSTSVKGEITPTSILDTETKIDTDLKDATTRNDFQQIVILAKKKDIVTRMKRNIVDDALVAEGGLSGATEKFKVKARQNHMEYSKELQDLGYYQTELIKANNGFKTLSKEDSEFLLNTLKTPTFLPGSIEKENAILKRIGLDPKRVTGDGGKRILRNFLATTKAMNASDIEVADAILGKSDLQSFGIKDNSGDDLLDRYHNTVASKIKSDYQQGTRTAKYVIPDGSFIQQGLNDMFKRETGESIEKVPVTATGEKNLINFTSDKLWQERTKEDYTLMTGQTEDGKSIYSVDYGNDTAKKTAYFTVANKDLDQLRRIAENNLRAAYNDKNLSPEREESLGTAREIYGSTTQGSKKVSIGNNKTTLVPTLTIGRQLQEYTPILEKAKEGEMITIDGKDGEEITLIKGRDRIVIQMPGYKDQAVTLNNIQSDIAELIGKNYINL